jgi:DNA-binding NarL/FixJ family response regulator
MGTANTMTIRVLLIDDHSSVLWGLEKLIDSQKPKMKTVGKFTSFEKASTEIGELSPDVILLDLDLGAENGLDIIPQLAPITQAKILILTGSRDKDAHDKCIIAGAKGVVQKENPAETILSAIEHVHEGQIWMDQSRIGNIIMQLCQKKTEEKEYDERSRIIDLLTNRERNIIVELTKRAGSTGCEVAKTLFISESTLRNHLSSIYAKLGLANKLELWEYAHKHGLNIADDLPKEQ